MVQTLAQIRVVRRLIIDVLGDVFFCLLLVSNFSHDGKPALIVLQKLN